MAFDTERFRINAFTSFVRRYGVLSEIAVTIEQISSGLLMRCKNLMQRHEQCGFSHLNIRFIFRFSTRIAFFFSFKVNVHEYLSFGVVCVI